MPTMSPPLLKFVLSKPGTDGVDITFQLLVQDEEIRLFVVRDHFPGVRVNFRVRKRNPISSVDAQCHETAKLFDWCHNNSSLSLIKLLTSMS